MKFEPNDAIRVVVADDERLARERLLGLLGTEADTRVVGLCENGLEALAVITALDPELVFLDVQMPDLDGIGVIEALSNEAGVPEIVFVTAHSAYMERAFELHAIDYLRKPYTDGRFTAALSHARKRVHGRRLEQAHQSGAPPLRRGGSGAGASQFASMLASLRSAQTQTRIPVQDRQTGTWQIVDRTEIDWIEADGPARVRVHVGAESYAWRKTLADLEQSLDPTLFLRVHRSAIVNAGRIRSVKSLQKGEYAIVLASGEMVDTGRTYREVVERFLAARDG